MRPMRPCRVLAPAYLVPLNGLPPSQLGLVPALLWLLDWLAAAGPGAAGQAGGAGGADLPSYLAAALQPVAPLLVSCMQVRGWHLGFGPRVFGPRV
jgi:hypothetical protein